MDGCTQTTLRVFFLTPLDRLTTPFTSSQRLTTSSLIITGDTDKSLRKPRVMSVPAVGQSQAILETANQCHSLCKKARALAYEIHDGARGLVVRPVAHVALLNQVG